MMFKIPKDQLLNQINGAAYSACSSTIQSTLGNSASGMVISGFQIAIAQAVEAGFRTMLEQVYTDAEFESDLTLR